MQRISKRNIRIILASCVIFILILIPLIYFTSRSNRSDNKTIVNEKAQTAQVEESTPVKEKDVASGTVITTGNSKFGPMLFDSRGQAIYIWEKEQSLTAECYGNCADAWPPVLSEGSPVASGDVNSELLGTTVRTDGTTQATYNGHPLYFYAHEEPGEVECHNIRTHGGLWWVIKPNGERAE